MGGPLLARPMEASGRGVFCCFRCNQPGHRALDCPFPPAQSVGLRMTMPMQPSRGRGRGVLDHSRLAVQTPDGDTYLSTQESRGPVEKEDVPPTPQGVEDQPPDDPMVNAPVHPFVIPVQLRNIHTSATLQRQALIDSGCTRCLMARTIVDQLGLHTVPLTLPIRFEQMDGSILGAVQ